MCGFRRHISRCVRGGRRRPKFLNRISARIAIFSAAYSIFSPRQRPSAYAGFRHIYLCGLCRYIARGIKRGMATKAPESIFLAIIAIPSDVYHISRSLRPPWDSAAYTCVGGFCRQMSSGMWKGTRLSKSPGRIYLKSEFAALSL